MPQAIHESTAFNSRGREVAIRCVFSVKDNTLTKFALWASEVISDSEVHFVSEVSPAAKCWANLTSLRA